MVELAILIPMAGAVAAAKSGEDSKARWIAAAAIAATLLATLEILREVLGAAGGAIIGLGGLPLFRVDRLGATSMALFAVLSLATVLAAPRRDCDRPFLSRVLVLLGAALAAYAAGSMIAFLIAWSICAAVSMMPRTIRAAAAVSLAAGVVLLEVQGPGPAAFTLLMVAAALQSGLFPAHRFAIEAFDRGPVLLTALSMNSLLGAYLMARATRLFPALTDGTQLWIGPLALFTCLYAALLGLVERDPRRLLAIVMVSQTAAILGGLVSGSAEGNAGALVQWVAVAAASTAMVVVYRCVEVRIAGNPGPLRYLGLAAQAPRLAVFFAAGALALIGIPGTPGFAGQQLLVHGALAGHSWWGIALPVAMAISAYHVYLLFTHLFLGRPVFRNTVADALPRERWALAALIVLLLAGGLLPGRVAQLREPSNPHQRQGQAMLVPRK